jgi:hypothetical protein
MTLAQELLVRSRCSTTDSTGRKMRTPIVRAVSVVVAFVEQCARAFWYPPMQAVPIPVRRSRRPGRPTAVR